MGGEPNSNRDDIARVLAHYRARINPGDTSKPYVRIGERLARFSADELCEAIDRFAANTWRMQHNAALGSAWFFESDQRVAMFRGLGAARKREYRDPAPSTDVERHYLGRYYNAFYDEQGRKRE